MATVRNARDLELQATSPRMISTLLPSWTTIDWGGVVGTGKPDDDADVTVTQVNGGITITGGGITFSSGGSVKGGQTAYATGTGWFLGYSGGAYKFSIGSSSKYLRWDGSAMTFQGNISGSGDIEITGNAVFDGVYSHDGTTYSVVGNKDGSATGGVAGHSGGTSGRGVYGQTGHSSGKAVYGASGISGSWGGYFTAGSATSTALYCDNSNASGKALDINGGLFQWGSESYALPDGNSYKFLNADGGWASVAATSSGSSTGTYVGTGKPGSSTNSQWAVINIGGTLFDIAVWPRA